MLREQDYSICCSFTGHRPNKLPWKTDEKDPRCKKLLKKLNKAIEDAYENGYRYFLCGMAQGADLLFCEAVLRFRESHPDVRVEAALPCPEQADRWGEAQRLRHELLCGSCDIQTMVQPFYTADCMHARDRYMISRSTRLIAVFNGTTGGTMYTVAQAMQAGLKIVRIDPDEL